MTDNALRQNPYPTGIDYQIFIENDDRPLDVKSVMLVEEGRLTPLYNFYDFKTDRFMHSTRMVSGQMQFNMNQRTMERMRLQSPALSRANRPGRRRNGIQRLQGVNVIVEMTKIQYHPSPKRIRERLKIRQLWSHPIQHSPEPYATENIKFTARDMILVAREEQTVDGSKLGEWVENPQNLSVTDAFEPTQKYQLAQIKEGSGTGKGVDDGDSFNVTFVEDQSETEVRLVGVDTPETPKEDVTKKTNEAFRLYWKWPDDAPANGGTPGEAPTAEQLDGWGCEARRAVVNWLDDGRYVWLIADSSGPEVGKYGRSLYQVRNLQGESLSEYLLQEGLAFPKNYPTENRVGGDPVGRHARLFDLFEEARSLAGTGDAKGVWAQFEPPNGCP